MTGAAFHISGVFLQHALVGIAFHIRRNTRPLLTSDEIDDEAAHLGGVLNLVLRLAKNEAGHPAQLAEFFERVAVMGFEFVTVFGE